MKKILCKLLSICTVMGLLAGCTTTREVPTPPQQEQQQGQDQDQEQQQKEDTNKTSSNDENVNASGSNQIQGKNNVELVSENVLKFKNTYNESNVSYLAEIKNTGTTAVRIKNLSIDLEDTSGSLLETTSWVSVYPEVINPGSSAYIAERIIYGEEGFDLGAVGNAILHFDAEESHMAPALDMEFTDITRKKSYDTTYYIGRIENKSDQKFEYVGIYAEVRAEDGTLQNFVYGSLDSLNPGEKKGFELDDLLGLENIDDTHSTVNVCAYDPSFY